MKKVIRNIAAMAACAFFLTQCATQDEMASLRNIVNSQSKVIQDQNHQIQNLNRKLQKLASETEPLKRGQLSSASEIDTFKDESLQHREKTTEELNKLQTEIADLRSSSREQVNTLEEQVNTLNKELEEERRKAQLAEEERRKAQLEAAKQRAQEASKRAEEAQERLRNVSSTSAQSSTFVRLSPDSVKKKLASTSSTTRGTSGDSFVTSTKPPASTSDTGVSGTNAPVSQTPEPSAQKTNQSGSYSSALSQAMEQYKNKRYQDAYKSFEDALGTVTPNGSDAATAQFYMGECLYEQKDYELAILDYQKVISNHSKHHLAPNALLKQGMSFEKLTDHETAKMIYKKLISTYSGSAEAKQAQSRLEKL